MLPMKPIACCLDSGKVSPIKATDRGIMVPVPMAWKNRPRISIPIFGAKAQTSEPKIKMVREIYNSAVTPFDHVIDDCPRAITGAVQIYINDAVPFRFG